MPFSFSKEEYKSERKRTKKNPEWVSFSASWQLAVLSAKTEAGEKKNWEFTYRITDAERFAGGLS